MVLIYVSPFCQACILLGLLAISSAQEENDRRARLRSLISAARGGDLEARKALQSLRSQIKNRRANNPRGGNRRAPASRPVPARSQADTAPVPAATPAPRIEVTTLKRIVPQEPQQIVEKTSFIEEPQPVQQRFNLQPRTRPAFAEEDIISHQVLHRGLEVDDRSEKFANIRVTNRTKTPPVETIRRYSYFDEEGNYIFGYEAADGSFKEEKRGKDCIVHGKYGYVDPTGVRR